MHNMDRLIIHSQDQLRFIFQNDIAYCKSDNSYTTLYLSNKEELIICKSLTKVLKDLSPQLFIRINQSYIVNKNYIKLIDKRKRLVELTDSRQIPFTTTISNLLNMIAQSAAILTSFFLIM
ncbi:MAG: hypothetical protein JWR38_1289 [Mucilaginibacter sp.]|nr:hypothetical protein [Mucilaginibacter sp.]